MRKDTKRVKHDNKGEKVYGEKCDTGRIHLKGMITTTVNDEI